MVTRPAVDRGMCVEDEMQEMRAKLQSMQRQEEMWLNRFKEKRERLFNDVVDNGDRGSSGAEDTGSGLRPLSSVAEEGEDNALVPEKAKANAFEARTMVRTLSLSRCIGPFSDWLL